ncbi:MAG: hypothetical protein JO103_09950 [Candidatus Eremiobacteraeota bacterium]|nr:hypothetical protein [Candidatus Eremiobacteraeota bacterium]
MRIAVGDQTCEALLIAAPVREVRLRALDVPALATRGASLPLRACVLNAGDVPESPRVTVEVDEPATIDGETVTIDEAAVIDDGTVTIDVLPPGGVRVVDLVAQVSSNTPAGAEFKPSIVAFDERGECARVTFAVTVRDDVELLAAAAVVEEAPESDASIAEGVRAAIVVPREVVAGAPFTVRLDVVIDDVVETLALRLSTPAGARTVPGSGTIDGYALLDEGGCSPFERAGLLVRSVIGPTSLAATCAFVADATPCDTDLVVAAELLAEGHVVPVASATVHVRTSAAFAERPAGLAFHIDARTVASQPLFDAPAPVEATTSAEVLPSEAIPQSEIIEVPVHVTADDAVADDDAFTFVLRIDDERRERIGRLLDGVHGPGLVGHVMIVRAFFPDEETSGDVRIAESLGGAVEAVGDLFDRLFVKLRIPGFEVTADDLDDVIVRRALVALFTALCDAPGGGSARTEAPCARLSRERIAELAEAIERAPYGAPAALRALVAFLPTRCEGEPVLGDALLRYALAIDDGLARCEGVPLERFDHALAHRTDAMLDDARAAVVSALRSRAVVGVGA